MKIALSLFCVLALFGAIQAKLIALPYLMYTLPNATTSEAVNNTDAKSLCLQTYLPLLSDYSALFTATSRQLVDCLSDGHEQTQCVQKYQRIFADIEANSTAISEKMAECLKADSTSTSSSDAAVKSN
ncbi:uncharacterized protein LOC129244129 [Anastrepha obliqua]|uniref:uncharacterized protein LOC129244129 n=1 Tax=Anastrepha obliqua TaxID=95512 RepID=UPI002409B840|nr:uncharacterized protein LOC129244129 [Anastrepha obliqua]